MSIYGEKLTFKKPTKAQVALTDSLVEVIKMHHRKSREHMFHLCMIAYGLRTHNLMKAKTGAGGNAQREIYKPLFRDWYLTNNLDDVYGSFSNFTHYAMAGRLLNYVRWQVRENYIDRLPSSMTALYELSRILWTQGDKATQESKKLFEEALIKPTKDGSKNSAFIHPKVTRKEIEKWRNERSDKPSLTKKASKVTKDDPHTVVIATIKVNQDLFKFARVSGEKRVGTKLEQVELLINELELLLNLENKGKSRFALKSHFDEVSRLYSEAKDPDYGKKILATKTSKPAAKAKAVKKRA